MQPLLLLLLLIKFVKKGVYHSKRYLYLTHYFMELRNFFGHPVLQSKMLYFEGKNDIFKYFLAN